MNIVERITKLNKEKYREQCPTCLAGQQLITQPCEHCGANLPKYFIDQARAEKAETLKTYAQLKETTQEHLHALSRRIESLEVELDKEHKHSRQLQHSHYQAIAKLIDIATETEATLKDEAEESVEQEGITQ